MVDRLDQNRQRWFGLALIWAVFTVHGIDRSVVLLLLEPIRREFVLNDSQVGLISGLGYALPFALAAVPVGALADRVRRTRLLAGLLTVWSLLTALAGLAPSYALLVLARAGVGASEAGAPPTMLSLIGDSFDARSRPAALAIYYTAPYAGLIGGSAVAGWIAQTHGWRAALLVVGLPGVALALIVAFLLREPPRGHFATASALPTPAASIPLALGFAWRSRELRRLIAALVLGAFVALGVASWVAVLLQRIYGFAPAHAGLATAAAVGVTGALGSLLGGVLAHRIGRGDPRRLSLLCGVTMLLALPLAIAAPLMATPGPAIVLIGLWSLLFTTYIGPGWGLAIDATPPHMRATIMALALLLTNLIGAGLGPQTVGLLSDLLAGRGDAKHLQHAMALLPLVGLVSVTLFLRRSTPSAIPEEDQGARHGNGQIR